MQAMEDGKKTPLLELRQLRVDVGRRTLVHATDLSLAQGEWKAIVGANGAGKSSLLKAVATLIPSAGEVLFERRPVNETGANFRSAIGLLLHEPLLYGDLSALENLILFARLYGVPQPAERAAQQLERVGLSAYADQPVRKFSRGMVQRLSLGRALMHEPKLLLLDEPLAGIDAAGIDRVLTLFRRVKEEGIAALWVTHRWDRAWPIVDEVLEMKRGRIHRRTQTAATTLAQWQPEHAEGVDVL